MRSQHDLTFRVLLKTVIMEHDLDDSCEVARWATRDRMEVFYQPVEQNYNTASDPRWFETSGNWPRDPAKTVRKVQDLAALKRAGWHIANTEAHFAAMLRYFQYPAGLRLATQAHVAHERKAPCCALTML
jgi:hypothetical protein